MHRLWSAYGPSALPAQPSAAFRSFLTMILERWPVTEFFSQRSSQPGTETFSENHPTAPRCPPHSCTETFSSSAGMPCTVLLVSSTAISGHVMLLSFVTGSVHMTGAPVYITGLPFLSTASSPAAFTRVTVAWASSASRLSAEALSLVIATLGAGENTCRRHEPAISPFFVSLVCNQTAAECGGSCKNLRVVEDGSVLPSSADGISSVNCPPKLAADAGTTHPVVSRRTNEPTVT